MVTPSLVVSPLLPPGLLSRFEKPDLNGPVPRLHSLFVPVTQSEIQSNLTVKRLMVEQLYQRYNSKSAQRDLRCLLGVLLDPVRRDQEIAKVLHELDCHAGETGAT